MGFLRDGELVGCGHVFGPLMQPIIDRWP